MSSDGDRLHETAFPSQTSEGRGIERRPEDGPLIALTAVDTPAEGSHADRSSLLKDTQEADPASSERRRLETAAGEENPTGATKEAAIEVPIRGDETRRNVLPSEAQNPSAGPPASRLSSPSEAEAVSHSAESQFLPFVGELSPSPSPAAAPESLHDPPGPSIRGGIIQIDRDNNGVCVRSLDTPTGEREGFSALRQSDSQMMQEEGRAGRPQEGIGREGSLRHVLRDFARDWSAKMRVRVSRVPIEVRLLFFLCGGLIGLLSASFLLASQFFEGVIRTTWDASPWAFWLTLPFGFVLLLACTRLFFDGTAGSGIPLEMWGLHVMGEPAMRRVLSWRIAIGKFGLTLAGQLAGASIGREGPTVQISSSVFYELIMFASRLKLFRFEHFMLGETEGGQDRLKVFGKVAILVGGAAGIAGAFNTPLGGIVFAIEEMGHTFDRALGHIMFCSVAISGVASIAVTGFYVWFGFFCGKLESLQYLYVVPISGVMGGLLGGFWSFVLLFGVAVKKATVFRKLPVPYLVAFVCGACVTLTGFFTNGETYGSGYSQAAAIIQPDAAHEVPPPTVVFGFLKMAASWFSYWSGIPGGIFAPSIAAGAGLGRFLYEVVFKHIDPGISEPGVAVVAATAYFAGVTQSPITTFAILMGMIECKTDVTVAMLAAALIGWMVSRRVWFPTTRKQERSDLFYLEFGNVFKGHPKSVELLDVFMIWAYHSMRGAFRLFNKKNPTYNSNPGGYERACVNDTEWAKSVLRAGLQDLHTILEECKYEEVKVKAVLESAVKACREGKWSDRGRMDGDRREESKRMGGDGKWNPTGAFFGPTEDGGVLWGSAAEAAGEEYRARPQLGDAEFPLRGDG
uniref:Chloride channel protein n=1 Tax=Chromera velia CCMP2878 TaxID=1169474 RepID=A0A0K6S9H8_9ALVE|eukprot:Cvel_30176.t1-p1 / transcript=Cvel_30176.t1 / gene=Cvel_30176 / organism=Chromera_velia_CCMP2878 / gene_product=H( )/Cl(-) exchange transporter ClcA, putative / transcript_product=H( )/Cl(-) exchange transporter ClcA, putative / location=Cvel_scaffold4264:1148-5689(-) / protein_length=854 / sequence_SO=supercontig / SO=protein_coding / is_pseudo=false